MCIAILLGCEYPLTSLIQYQSIYKNKFHQQIIFVPKKLKAEKYHAVSDLHSYIQHISRTCIGVPVSCCVNTGVCPLIGIHAT